MRRYHDFVEKFLSRGAKNFHRETLRCHRNFLYHFFKKRGYHDLVQTSLSHSAKKHSQGTFLFFKIFSCRKNSCIREGYHDFQSNLFRLTVPKHLVKHLVCVEKSSCSKYFLHIKNLSNILCLTVPKQFLVEALNVSENFFFQFFFSHITILSKISCLTVPKRFVEEPFCVSENSWFLRVLWIRRNITVVCPKAFVAQYLSVS